MSVEGMWALQSDQYNAPGQLVAGSIIILESGKIFGGDSMMAFLGSYTVDGNVLNGNVRAWRWNPSYAGQQNVFGIDPGPTGVEVTFSGTRENDSLLNVSFSAPGFAPRQGRLTKLEELP
jgi:hypothetical protein